VKPVVKIVTTPGNDGAPMAFVPAGTFVRGSRDGHGEPDESPRRLIYLDAFYIDQFEVTVARYRRCVEAGACGAPEQEKQCNWADAARTLDPVNCVSWNQSDEYCRWAGKRLPTEAEWEKAARGTDGRVYPWGAEAPNCTLANFYTGSHHYCRGRTVAATEYMHAASPYGAVQMAGNVYEWTADWYAKDAYARAPARNPRGPARGRHRVVRGGSWFTPGADLRVTLRGPVPPVVRFNYLGFRCAASASPSTPP